jgi:hypothetical protein
VEFREHRLNAHPCINKGSPKPEPMAIGDLSSIYLSIVYVLSPVSRGPKKAGDVVQSHENGEMVYFQGESEGLRTRHAKGRDKDVPAGAIRHGDYLFALFRPLLGWLMPTPNGGQFDFLSLWIAVLTSSSHTKKQCLTRYLAIL